MYLLRALTCPLSATSLVQKDAVQSQGVLRSSHPSSSSSSHSVQRLQRTVTATVRPQTNVAVGVYQISQAGVVCQSLRQLISCSQHKYPASYNDIRRSRCLFVFLHSTIDAFTSNNETKQFATQVIHCKSAICSYRPTPYRPT